MSVTGSPAWSEVLQKRKHMKLRWASGALRKGWLLCCFPSGSSVTSFHFRIPNSLSVMLFFEKRNSQAALWLPGGFSQQEAPAGDWKTARWDVQYFSLPGKFSSRLIASLPQLRSSLGCVCLILALDPPLLVNSHLPVVLFPDCLQILSWLWERLLNFICTSTIRLFGKPLLGVLPLCCLDPNRFNYEEIHDKSLLC